MSKTIENTLPGQLMLFKKEPVIGSHNERMAYSGEINSGELVTDRSGYVPIEKRIKQFESAGVRLIEHRREMYDGEYDDDLDDYEDPTRDPGFDLEESSEEIRRIRENGIPSGKGDLPPEEIGKTPEKDVRKDDPEEGSPEGETSFQ